MELFAGLLTSRKVLLRIEIYMMMRPNPHGPSMTKLKNLANVLLKMSRVSRGHGASVTIIGRRDASWIAAVAGFIHVLSASIRDTTGYLRQTGTLKVKISDAKAVEASLEEPHKDTNETISLEYEDDDKGDDSAFQNGPNNPMLYPYSTSARVS